MRKIYATLIGLAGFAGMMCAQNVATELKAPISLLKEMKSTDIKEAKTAVYAENFKAYKKALTSKAANMQKKPHKAAPESIVGNTYVTTYNDDEDNYTSYITVEAGTDGNSVVLKNFAEGYDVNGTYDASTGKLNIPVGVVIGTYGNYGNITLYSLDDAGYYSGTTPITATVIDNEIVFDNGVYAAVSAGGLVVQFDLVGKKPNATYTGATSTKNISLPMLVSKTAEDEITVTGMGMVCAMGAFNGRTSAMAYPTVFTLDATAKTATSDFNDPIDNYGQYGNFYYGMIEGGYITDLSFNVAVADNQSTLSTSNQTYVGYKNGTSYSGAFINNTKLVVDMDVFTAPVEEEEGGDEPEEEWTSLGEATFMDGWVLPLFGIDQNQEENWFKVEIQQNVANENLYRLVDPYHAAGFPAKSYNESNKVGYIEFDVTDPDHVLVNPHMQDAGFALSDVGITKFYPYNTLQFFVNYYGMPTSTIVSLMGEDGMPYTTFKDGVLLLGFLDDEGDPWYDANFGDQYDNEGGYFWNDEDGNPADMTTMILFPGATPPVIEGEEVTGNLTTQTDMNMGQGEPDLLPADEYSVTALYNADAQTITLTSFTEVSEDASSGLEGLYPLTLTINVEEGKVIAKGEQISSVDDWDPEEPQEFYYMDINSEDYGVTGTIANLNDEQCIIKLNPWGEGDMYPGYGFFTMNAYYNTEIVLDLNIEGLAYVPQVKIENLAVKANGNDIDLTIAYSSLNLPEGATVYAEVFDIFNDKLEAVFDDPQVLTVSPAVLTIPDAAFVDGEPAWYNFRVELVVKDEDGEAIASDVAETGQTTSIESIDADGNAVVRYFNLQGVEVANPTGVVIKVEGGKASKVIL